MSKNACAGFRTYRSLSAGLSDVVSDVCWREANPCFPLKALTSLIILYFTLTVEMNRVRWDGCPLKAPYLPEMSQILFPYQILFPSLTDLLKAVHNSFLFPPTLLVRSSRIYCIGFVNLMCCGGGACLIRPSSHFCTLLQSPLWRSLNMYYYDHWIFIICKLVKIKLFDK